jgi:hypothetical protein
MTSGKFAGYQNLEGLEAFFPIDNAAGEATPKPDMAPAREILAIFQDAGKKPAG